MACQLSVEDLSMIEIIKVLKEVDKASRFDMASIDRMAAMIDFTDAKTKQTFGRIYAAIQAGKMSDFLHSSARPGQQEVWTACAATNVPTIDSSYAAALQAAAKLIIDTWIDYPRPGTEHPYTLGAFNGSQHRRRVCQVLFLNAQTLLQRLDYVDHMNQNRGWKYTVAALFDKLSW